MKAEQTILTRLLPKTGQTVEYVAGDDGTTEIGWWRGRKIADNKTRFITKTLDGDDVVIDLATGLMWAADGDESGCGSGAARPWVATLGEIASLDFAGFEDWRLPNVLELISIINFGLHSPAISEPPFANTASRYYFSSTTRADNTLNVWGIDFDIGDVYLVAKSSNGYCRAVRGGR